MNEFDLGVVAFILVASISIAYGIACTLVLRRLVNHEVMRAASRRFLAHLLESRLFIDDPVLILRSQRDLIVSYFALLRALAPAAAALLMPSVLALFVLQNWFAKAPLPLDRPAVVTAHLKRMCNLTLATPPGVRIDTDALRALASNEVSWRVTPTAAVNTPLLVEGASERIEYRIVTGRSFFGARSM